MNRNVNQRDRLSDESGSRQFALLVFWQSGSQDDGKVNIDSSIILQYNNIFGLLSIRSYVIISILKIKAS